MIDLVRQRRSIRKYQQKPIEPEKIKLLEETLLRSPTSRNFRPWEFILVDDRDLLNKLSHAKPHGNAFLKEAPLGIVICGNSEKSDVWIEDCSIASILVQMTAQSLGLGSCWIQIRRRQHDEKQSAEAYIQDLLNLPRHIKVESIISIGYAAEERAPLPAEEFLQDKIHHNHF
ncbi:NAD(P)H-dependent dehydrogenase/reductase [candidate division KSB1 bacterium]|nr:NAD(P)H-dependent dehydrogenase/reductase [candidate division KSB1 bacterium]